MNRLIRRLAGILFVPRAEWDNVFNLLLETIPTNDGDENLARGTVAKLHSISEYFR